MASPVKTEPASLKSGASSRGIRSRKDSWSPLRGPPKNSLSSRRDSLSPRDSRPPKDSRSSRKDSWSPRRSRPPKGSRSRMDSWSSRGSRFPRESISPKVARYTKETRYSRGASMETHPPVESWSPRFASPTRNASPPRNAHYPDEPSAVDPHIYEESEFEFDDVSDEEVAMIRSRLVSYIKPTSISKVRNPYLWEKYQERKEEYSRLRGNHTNELSLWHATSEENAESIVRNNFDRRCAVRSLYGYGVCFSTDAGYANFHCNKEIGNLRALILANVLVGKTFAGHPELESPPEEYDTAIDSRGMVCIKFGDHEFYPAFVVYYDNRFYSGESEIYEPVHVDMGFGSGSPVDEGFYNGHYSRRPNKRQRRHGGNYNYQADY